MLAAIPAKSAASFGAGVVLMTRRPAIDAKPATVALDEFLAELIAMEPGATIQIAEICDHYEATRVRRRSKGWPAVSQRAMALRLAAAGAVKGQIDLRAEGQGRPIVYTLPGEMAVLAAA